MCPHTSGKEPYGKWIYFGEKVCSNFHQNIRTPTKGAAYVARIPAVTREQLVEQL